MSQIDCSACDDLRNIGGDFPVNGVTPTVAASLANNTGFNPSLTVTHTDCEDLNDANDCLVGRMDQELEAYEMCDWKDYMHKFIPNVYEVIKAVIAAVCGLWVKIAKHDCEIQNLYNGFSFSVGEDETDGSYLVAGKGVSFAMRTPSAQDPYSNDYGLAYIAGGLLRGTVSVSEHTEDFTDTIPVWNFDNGETAVKSQSRKGNSYWSQIGVTAVGNELLVEARINLSKYPQVKGMYGGIGQSLDRGGYLVTASVFEAGTYAPGQHGDCDPATGEPHYSGADRGHLVPSGWAYIQTRVHYIMNFEANTTPRWFMGIRFKRDSIKC